MQLPRSLASTSLATRCLHMHRLEVHRPVRSSACTCTGSSQMLDLAWMDLPRTSIKRNFFDSTTSKCCAQAPSGSGRACRCQQKHRLKVHRPFRVRRACRCPHRLLRVRRACRCLHRLKVHRPFRVRRACRCPHMRRLKVHRPFRVRRAYRCQQRHRLKGHRPFRVRRARRCQHTGPSGSGVSVRKCTGSSCTGPSWSGVFAGARACTGSRCTGSRCPGPCPGPVGHFPLACQAGWGAALILSFCTRCANLMRLCESQFVRLCETQLYTLSCVLGVGGLRIALLRSAGRSPNQRRLATERSGQSVQACWV